ncbi:MAG: helix-turn-helix transcriptional regulator [Bacillota bacterium]|jgi:PadR family transcriptional regulator PadR
MHHDSGGSGEHGRRGDGTKDMNHRDWDDKHRGKPTDKCEGEGEDKHEDKRQDIHSDKHEDKREDIHDGRHEARREDIHNGRHFHDGLHKDLHTPDKRGEEVHNGHMHKDWRHKDHHGCHRRGHGEHVVRPERFMEPCLLLLLTENVSYGYDLISRLREFGFGDNQDPGMVYRYLRRLEKRGMIESKWDTTGTGPARRMYKVTADGDELLSVWAETIRSNIAVLQQFLERYEKAIQAKNPREAHRASDDSGGSDDEKLY